MDEKNKNFWDEFEKSLAKCDEYRESKAKKSFIISTIFLIIAVAFSIGATVVILLKIISQ